MGIKATFDVTNLLVILDQVAPDANDKVSIDVKVDLYSDAKEDWLAEPSYAGIEFPFLTIGGDDLGGGLTAGDYYFLRTDLGWRIRPYEATHEVTLVGNLYAVDPDDPLTTPVLGAYTVGVFFERSQLTQTLEINSGSGLSAAQDTVLTELHRRLGLESGTPMVATASSIVAGDITLTMTGDPDTEVTTTRV